jgi:hypothetical protein
VLYFILLWFCRRNKLFCIGISWSSLSEWAIISILSASFHATIADVHSFLFNYSEHYGLFVRPGFREWARGIEQITKHHNRSDFGWVLIGVSVGDIERVADDWIEKRVSLCVYNTATNTTLPLAQMPDYRWQYGMALVDNTHVLVCGGWNSGPLSSCTQLMGKKVKILRTAPGLGLNIETRTRPLQLCWQTQCHGLKIQILLISNARCTTQPVTCGRHRRQCQGPREIFQWSHC